MNISAGKDCIQFDHKTLEAIWLLGFNGWRSIETYSPAVILAGITGGSLEDALRSDDELAVFEMDYKSRSNSARSIIEEKSSVSSLGRRMCRVLKPIGELSTVTKKWRLST